MHDNADAIRRNPIAAKAVLKICRLPGRGIRTSRQGTNVPTGLSGGLGDSGKRTKPEYDRKQAAYENMWPAGESGGRNPSASGGPTSLGTRLGKIFRGVKTALVPRKQPSQLPLFQTKPESYRKEGGYKNMSKVLGWLGAAARFLLKGGRYHRQQISPGSLKREGPSIINRLEPQHGIPSNNSESCNLHVDWTVVLW